jgi:hypothetical protein
MEAQIILDDQVIDLYFQADSSSRIRGTVEGLGQADDPLRH